MYLGLCSGPLIFLEPPRYKPDDAVPPDFLKLRRRCGPCPSLLWSVFSQRMKRPVTLGAENPPSQIGCRALSPCGYLGACSVFLRASGRYYGFGECQMRAGCKGSGVIAPSAKNSVLKGMQHLMRLQRILCTRCGWMLLGATQGPHAHGQVLYL